MRQAKAKMTGGAYGAGKITRKRRRSPVCFLPLFLGVLIGFFYYYKSTGGNEQITPPTRVLSGYQTEILPTSAAAPAPIQWAISTDEIPNDEESGGDISNDEALTNEIPVLNRLMPDLYINSQNAVLMDFEKGILLFDKNGTEKMYPASMTKIMTALVALEHIEDLDEIITLNQTIFQPIYNANAVTAGFLPGESVRAIDLLYGLLLPSGAECAVGLAEYVAGSENTFVDLMNDKAFELGMSGSHFTNTIGLHDDNHYSTALDMAVLLRYALEEDTFYEIFTSSRHSTSATNQHTSGITYYSTLFSRIDDPAFTGGSVLGGKTGYTNEAGQCLASLAVKDGKKYLLVTSGALGNNQSQELHIDDAFTVYNALREDGEPRYRRIKGLEGLD